MYHKRGHPPRASDGIAIRIPAAVLRAAKIEVGDPVEIRMERERIVIERVRPVSRNLGDLVGKITLHGEIDFSRPAGKQRI